MQGTIFITQNVPGNDPGKIMKPLQFSKKYALIQYSIAVLENYNPEVMATSDDIEYLENIDTEVYGVSTGFTIVEKKEDGTIEDYYSGEVFEMSEYK